MSNVKTGVAIKKNGDKITVTFSAKDPLTKEAIEGLCSLLKQHGRTDEAAKAQAAIDEPPDIDPGG